MHFLLIEHSGLSWRSCQEKKNNLSQQEMYNLTEHLLGSTVKNKVGLVGVFFMLQTVWCRHPHAVSKFQTRWQRTNLVVQCSLPSWLSYHDDEKVKIFLDHPSLEGPHKQQPSSPHSAFNWVEPAELYNSFFHHSLEKTFMGIAR